MSEKFKYRIQKILKNYGYQITKTVSRDPVMDEEFDEIYQQCNKYTMTTKERMYALFKAVNYIISANIDGDFVECGVWRGGSAMVIAATLKSLNVTDRKIYLYDTFEGMPRPTSNDRSLWAKDNNPMFIWENEYKTENSNNWMYASLDDVSANMGLTGYPKENLFFVKGMVESTIPNTRPDKICLLRLDTDWYESTKHELESLYPFIEKNGVLVIDDYGYWAGAKKAVDEYFASKPILLSRVDYSGRVGIKVF